MTNCKMIMTLIGMVGILGITGCGNASENIYVDNEERLSKPEETIIEQVEAGEEIIVKYTYITDDPESHEVNFPEVVEQSGEKYYYKGDAQYDYKELMVAVTTRLDLEVDESGEVAPSTDYVSDETGNKYILDKSYVNLGEKTTIDRIIKERIDYGLSGEIMNYPKTKELTYYCDVTGQDEVVEASLIDSGILEEGFVEDNPVMATFEATDRDVYVWKLGDKSIELSQDAPVPVWEGYEADILESLGLSGSKYKITNAAWESEEVIEGTIKKYAKYDVQTYAYKQYAEYEAVGKQYGYKANVIYYGDADKLNAPEKDRVTLYTVEVTVHYIKEAPLVALLFDYKDINPDVIGIISIKDSILNHPVCVTPNDEDYYLRRDLYGEDNSHGVPFVNVDYSFTKAGYNNIIYGHNICKTDRDVFADIPKYADENYAKTHPYIRLITEEGISYYQVMAYCVVNHQKDDFDYYKYTYFQSMAQFEYFMDNVRKRNRLSMAAEGGISDNYITLSTCSLEDWGSGTNRCFILAKKVYI